jgi:hypothetical protein
MPVVANREPFRRVEHAITRYPLVAIVDRARDRYGVTGQFFDKRRPSLLLWDTGCVIGA